MGKPQETMAKWVPALAAYDVDAVNALLHPDFKLYEPDGVPYCGEYAGKEGFWELWEKFCATWTDVSISGHHIFESTTEDACAVLMYLSGKAVRTGKDFSTSLIELYRLKDGLIIEIKPFYFDTKYLAELQGS